MNRNPFAHSTEDDESSDYCKAHGREFWPSEGCPSCAADQRERTAVHSVVDALIDIGSGIDKSPWSKPSIFDECVAHEEASRQEWWQQQDQDDQWIENQLD